LIVGCADGFVLGVTAGAGGVVIAGSGGGNGAGTGTGTGTGGSEENVGAGLPTSAVIRETL
jgi:hypothetical protein